MNEWTSEKSEELYNVKLWGSPYFSINGEGHLEVSPQGKRPGLDIYNLVEDLKKRGLEPPLVLRFSDILAHRLKKLHNCFNEAIATHKYEGSYQSIYPIKVNQQKHVVEELLHFAKEYTCGLEAGSKPEMLIALSMLSTQKGSLIICNGYKDSEYLETALLAQKLGLQPIIVLERYYELDMVTEVSARLGISPILGIRARLSCKGSGKWADSSGDRAKFGLNAAEIIDVVEKLKKNNMLDCLQLLHFHIGSQITDIKTIKEALNEASYFYAELLMMGAPMKYLDVGGGLGVDYDGSESNFHSSKNYSMEAYAADVVATIQTACKEKNCAYPIIMSESGRALVAHHSMVIINVLGVEDMEFDITEKEFDLTNDTIRDLYQTYVRINDDNLLETYNDVIQAKSESLSLFSLGYLSLKERGQIEKICWASLSKIKKIVKRLELKFDELEDLDRTLAGNYYCNFSVFQSIPDSWALKQLFPIMPIHRLNEEATERGIISDLTCDSDGKIDQFIDVRDVKRVLPLHKWKEGEPYFLGIFLTGAYQEIMGDYHNLFGATHAVHLHVNGDGYKVEHVIEGDSMTEVMNSVEYERAHLIEAVRRATEASLLEKQMTIEESRLLLKHYSESLMRYTYLNSRKNNFAVVE